MYIINEKPLDLLITKKYYTTILRTPGDEKAHVVGYCFSEGIIEKLDDIVNIEYIQGENSDIAQIEINSIKTDLFNKMKSPTVSESLNQITSNSKKVKKLDPLKIIDLFKKLEDYQVLRKKTASTHAVAFFDYDLKMLGIKEDVGRHNAFDKIIGETLIKRNLKNAYLALLSSRVSFELINRGIKAGISCMFSVSRPTSLAIDLAQKYNVTLSCLSKPKGIYCFSGFERIKYKL